MSRTSSRGILALGLLVASVPPVRGAFPALEDGVKVSGLVTAGEDELPLEGARVDFLEEGLLSRGTAWTDERGRYTLEVQSAIYDLRVLPPSELYVADFARDLDLRGREPHQEDFHVRERDDALRTIGIEPEELLDGDGDAVPDALEGPVGLDWELADTNEDGELDGLTGWFGADPLVGPERTEHLPDLSWPPPGVEMEHPVLAAGATPPLELLFRAVPGASGYQLRVHSTSSRLERTWNLHYEDGELLLGEGVALRWVPPGGWKPGEYEIEVQGFYEAPDRPVGEVARSALRLQEWKELDPIEITEETILSGSILGSTIHLREGVRVTVPAGETLRLAATGDVVIERRAELVGEVGASIVIHTAGDLQVMGTITGGEGEPGEDETVGQTAGGSSVARGGPGGGGGDVQLVALGTVWVGREAKVASGDGGRGGDAEARAASGKDALAIGGNGGRGGRLLVHASVLSVADRPDLLHCGSGGRGGDGDARGGGGSEDVQAGLSSALSGVGGDSGDIWLSDWDLRRDGYVPLHDDSFPVRGGLAGAPGLSKPTYGTPGTFDGKRSRPGRVHEVICGVRGGHGWSRGGDGQSAIARGGEGLGSGDGGGAIARGGPGGGVSRIGVSSGAFRLTFGFLPTGGTGGAAEATGGPGGAGTFFRPQSGKG